MRAVHIFILAEVLMAMFPGYSASAQDKYQDPGMKKVIQVGMVVRDIEASSKRWSELLGVPLPPIRTTRPGHEVKVVYRGKPSDGRAKLAFINLGQVVLELIEPVGEGTSWKEYLDKKGEGVQHLGFQIADPERASQAMVQAGMPVLHQGRYDSDNGTYIYIDSQDSLGVVLELLHSDSK
jgi:methylmalonyl-CoA/ethylmalonyl-CoA epimerase